MSKASDEAELELLRAIAMAQSLGGPEGPAAWEVYQRACSAEVRPRLLKAQAAMEAVDREATMLEKTGQPMDEELLAAGQSADEFCLAMEAEVAEVWHRALLDVSALIRRAA